MHFYGLQITYVLPAFFYLKCIKEDNKIERVAMYLLIAFIGAFMVFQTYENIVALLPSTSS